MKTEERMNCCHFCGEDKLEMLYNKGGKKVCSVCIKIILEILVDYVNNEK